ncbi:MAG: PBP1A family penicillin-binding protein [Alphaproteobacteria bacterium]|nr:PBP1A family penicillin-binding protein [Alphaproteobacteria bacterium]
MRKKKKAASQPSRQKKRLIWRLLKWSFFSVFWAVALSAVVISWYAKDLPEIQGFDLAHKKPSIVFLTKDHREIATHGHLYGETVTLDHVPKALINALIATEDRRFFEHNGIDFQGLVRAFVKNITTGHVVQGGSTLTQQLVKNIFLSHERSLKRKIQEVILALWIEKHFSKEQILNIYINRVYLGGGTFGVDAASQLYFGKLVAYLSLEECAVIAGLLKAPSRYANHHDQLKARAHVVLDNMVQANFITEKQKADAIQKVNKMTFDTKPMPSYRYFTDWVSGELENLVDTSQDLIVITTLDSALQTTATKAVHDFIKNHGKASSVEQASFVALSKDGAVRSMVGGTHYFSMQYNLAATAQRQIGSAFKPVVFLAALEQGLRFSDMIDDSPYKKGSWEVNNFGWQARGQVSLHDALVYSINTATVRLAEKIGINAILHMAQRLGFAKPDRDLTIALGTIETSLLNVVNAFMIIANQGKETHPYGILEIRNSDGKILYQRPASSPKEVIDPSFTQRLSAVLENVVKVGTGKAAQIPGKTVAGKTGTSQKFRDAWFIGFTDSITAGVWMGNPSDAPMNRVVGGSLPAQLWKIIVEKYTA